MDSSATDHKPKLAALTEEELRTKAFERILRSLAVSEQSTLKMRIKLESAGFPADSISWAIDHAQEMGILDDRRYADSLIRSTIASGKGLRHVECELAKLGLALEELPAYRDYLELGEESQIDSAVAYLLRHPSRAKDVRGSAMRKLINRGFSTDIATQATRKYLDQISA